MIRKHSDPEHPDARRGLGQRLFALMMGRAEGEYPDFYEKLVGDYKRWLFADLSGTVVEIGAGTGANFQYYPRGLHWIGIEPNLFMHEGLLRTAERYGIQGEIRVGVAERIEMPDNSADAVISTLVLCSIDGQDAVMREILRVLKPGGSLLFVEHVAAPERSRLRTMQNLINPVWKVVADGCHPNRDTLSAVERAGFSKVEAKAFRAPIPIVSPHVAGKAIK